MDNKMNDMIECFEKITKSTKGYMYDSLCFRYKIARMESLEKETKDLMLQGYQPEDAKTRALKAAKRDCLRFYEILDEAIGEHD